MFNEIDEMGFRPVYSPPPFVYGGRPRTAENRGWDVLVTSRTSPKINSRRVRKAKSRFLRQIKRNLGIQERLSENHYALFMARWRELVHGN